MQAGLEARIAQEKWKNAARVASNLSELTLTLGEVPRAVAFGAQSVELADRSGDAFMRLVNLTAWVDALHQAGRWEESAAAFREAEAMQAERQPEYPRLYSLRGFRYCDLLLGRAEPEDGAGLDGIAGPGSRPEEAERFRQTCREVMERARQALEWVTKVFYNMSLLDSALDHLTLGRAHLGLALPAAEPAASMRLHACDAHLEGARLCRDQGELEETRRHMARARELVKETGYGRQEREVAWLERTLGVGPTGRENIAQG